VQYEMFYAGAQFVTRGHSFRTYDWAAAGSMAQALMHRYPSPAPIDHIDRSTTASL
jgi:4-hydroxyphenylacetate 3-monooxygenase